MDSKKAKLLREKLEQLFKTFEFDNELVVEINNRVQYDDVNAYFKIEIRDAKSVSLKESDLIDMARADDIDITKIATINNMKFTLTGYNRKARTNVYEMQRVDNPMHGVYPITRTMAKRYFGKAV